jgi:hypothetical protein
MSPQRYRGSHLRHSHNLPHRVEERAGVLTANNSSEATQR